MTVTTTAPRLTQRKRGASRSGATRYRTASAPAKTAEQQHPADDLGEDGAHDAQRQRLDHRRDHGDQAEGDQDEDDRAERSVPATSACSLTKPRASTSS